MFHALICYVAHKGNLNDFLKQRLVVKRMKMQLKY